MAESVRVSADMILQVCSVVAFSPVLVAFSSADSIPPFDVSSFRDVASGIGRVLLRSTRKLGKTLGFQRKTSGKVVILVRPFVLVPIPPQVLVPPRPRCSFRRRTVPVTRKPGKCLQRGATLVPAPVYPSPGVDGVLWRRASIGAGWQVPPAGPG